MPLATELFSKGGLPATEHVCTRSYSAGPPHLCRHLLQLHMHLCPLSPPVLQLLLSSVRPDLCLAQRLLPATRISGCCSHPLLSSLHTCSLCMMSRVTSAICLPAVFPWQLARCSHDLSKLCLGAAHLAGSTGGNDMQEGWMRAGQGTHLKVGFYLGQC